MASNPPIDPSLRNAHPSRKTVASASGASQAGKNPPPTVRVAKKTRKPGPQSRQGKRTRRAYGEPLAPYDPRKSVKAKAERKALKEGKTGTEVRDAIKAAAKRKVKVKAASMNTHQPTFYLINQ
jgi:hypothetical protein